MTTDNARTRICSIDIFRYVCAIMVVAIHTSPFSEINKELGYIFTEIIPRIGVPFFFAVTGYFYIQKLEKAQKPFFAYFIRLISTYFLWSLLYYFIAFIRRGNLNLKDFIVNSVYSFIITGSYYHFWFFPALIFAVCFTTFLFKIKCDKVLIPLSIFLYIIGCFGCSYYEIGIQIPILRNLFLSPHFNLIRRVLLMGVPFFVSGYLVYKIKSRNITMNKLLCGEVMAVAIWLVEIYIVRMLKWEVNIIVTFGLYLLVTVTLLILLENPLKNTMLSQISNGCRTLANFTYYSHPFFILCLSVLGNHFLHMNITATPMFFLTVISTFVVGFIIYKLDNRFLNQIVN